MGRFTVSCADAVKIVNEVFCDNNITGAALAIHVAALEISRKHFDEMKPSQSLMTQEEFVMRINARALTMIAFYYSIGTMIFIGQQVDHRQFMRKLAFNSESLTGISVNSQFIFSVPGTTQHMAMKFLFRLLTLQSSVRVKDVKMNPEQMQ